MSNSNDNISIRLPEKTREKIEEIANNLDRSRNWVINEAVEQYVQSQQWQIEVISERMHLASKKDATFIEHEQVIKRERKHLKEKLKI